MGVINQTPFRLDEIQLIREQLRVIDAWEKQKKENKGSDMQGGCFQLHTEAGLKDAVVQRYTRAGLKDAVQCHTRALPNLM